MLYEIKDIASYYKEENKPMLSTYGSDFWKPYRDNFNYFDRLFMKKYRSWFPMDQEGDLEEVSKDFTFDVYAWLLTQEKRYSELFRILQITDDEHYSLTDNVYEVETIEESGEHSSTFNKGEQTDTEDLEAVKGSQTDTQDNERVKGSQTDTQDNERVKGSQTDTQDNERVKGQEQIDTDATNTTGATGKTITNQVSAFNDSTFANSDKSVEEDDSREDTIDQTVVEGERTDTEDLSTTYGQRTDTEDLSTTYGQRTDTEDLSTTYGQRTDTQDNSRVSGAREDTEEGTDSKTITRNRSGNIGVKTVAQMLEEQWDTWGIMDFYGLVFSEITRELLRGC